MIMPDFKKEHAKAMKMKNCGAHNFIPTGSMWGKGDSVGNIYYTKVGRCECGKQDFDFVRIENCPKGCELNILYK